MYVFGPVFSALQLRQSGRTIGFPVGTPFLSTGWTFAPSLANVPVARKIASRTSIDDDLICALHRLIWRRYYRWWRWISADPPACQFLLSCKMVLWRLNTEIEMLWRILRGLPKFFEIGLVVLNYKEAIPLD